jgi:hypothetical protein
MIAQSHRKPKQMASGYGRLGGKGRCYQFWKDFEGTDSLGTTALH